MSKSLALWKKKRCLRGIFKNIIPHFQFVIKDTGYSIRIVIQESGTPKEQFYLFK